MALALSPVAAATISPVGETLNVPDWHSTTAKTFTIPNMPSVYGYDGYVMFGVVTGSSGTSTTFGTNFVASNDNGATVHQGVGFASGLPSFVSSMTAGTSFDSAAWNFSTYALGDDPRLTSSASVIDAQIGGIVSPVNQTVGSSLNLLNWTVGTTIAQTVRVGIPFGTVGSAYFSPTAITMTVNGGGSQTVAVTDAISSDSDTQVNWVFFDVGGLQASDVLRVYGTVRDRPANVNDRVAISGITFDLINSPAASVQAAGAQYGLSQFRTTTVAKPFDADNDNVYGTDGYVLFNTMPNGIGSGSGEAPLSNARISLPTYVGAFTPGTGTLSAHGFGYLPVDDPDLTPGTMVADLSQSGLLASPNTGLAGTEFLMFSFALTDDMLTGFRLGLFTDNGNLTRFTPTALRVASTNGSQGTFTNLLADLNGDWYFFDLFGSKGDVFFVYATTREDFRPATLGGVTFDSIVPEPESWLLLVGLVAPWLAFRRWRKSKPLALLGR